MYTLVDVVGWHSVVGTCPVPPGPLGPSPGVPLLHLVELVIYVILPVALSLL